MDVIGFWLPDALGPPYTSALFAAVALESVRISTGLRRRLLDSKRSDGGMKRIQHVARIMCGPVEAAR